MLMKYNDIMARYILILLLLVFAVSCGSNSSSKWKNRSRLGQCAGADWDTFDAAKLMIFSETVAF